MKSILALAILLLSPMVASAQIIRVENVQPPPMIPMGQLLQAREQLIKTLVGHDGVLGVSICGSYNELQDTNTNWLAVYVEEGRPAPSIPSDITESVPVFVIHRKMKKSEASNAL